MSLAHLLRMRRAGKRPDTVVVIVGKPSAIDDSAHYVVIDKDPKDMDLRALVGMPIHLIDVQGDLDLTLAVMAATEAAGVKVLGACSSVGSCGVSPEHEHAMTRYRELLCLA